MESVGSAWQAKPGGSKQHYGTERGRLLVVTTIASCGHRQQERKETALCTSKLTGMFLNTDSFRVTPSNNWMCTCEERTDRSAFNSSKRKEPAKHEFRYTFHCNNFDEIPESVDSSSSCDLVLMSFRIG